MSYNIFIDESNFKDVLYMVGYYEAPPFSTEDEVRQYLTLGNVRRACGGQCHLSKMQLWTLTEFALKFRENLQRTETVG